MNKGKSSGAKLKDNMFKDHEVLNKIFTDFSKKIDSICVKCEEDLLSFQVTKINQGYIGNLFLHDGSGIISSVASISLENRTFSLVVHEKNKISSVTTTIEKARGLSVSKDGNVLRIIIPDPTEERREKVIKEMNEHSLRYITQINSDRSKVIDILKDIESKQKQNKKKKDSSSDAFGVSEDDLKKAKELVEQIKNEKLEKLNASLTRHGSDIKKGAK
jgi:ribosome recycling factor